MVTMTTSKMLCIALLPLVLFSLSMVAFTMGQTFQYSRGWTNGKRSQATAAALGGAHLHDDDIFELQDGDRKLEKCLLQLQRFVRNPLLLRAAGYTGVLSITPSSSSTSQHNNNNNNNNNNPFETHHQSNELFEELSAVEPNDYGKH